MRTSKVPAIAALLADTPDGHCCFCQDPITGRGGGTRPPLHCGGDECAASYHRLYAERRRELNWERGLTAWGTKKLADVHPAHRSRAGRPREVRP